jgi:hypothetical protein
VAAAGTAHEHGYLNDPAPYPGARADEPGCACVQAEQHEEHDKFHRDRHGPDGGMARKGTLGRAKAAGPGSKRP